MYVVSQSSTDTQKIAAGLARRILTAMTGKARATIVALRGELGAGKTTFAQGFARALGVAENPRSPTFLLAKQYRIPGTAYSLWHLDCYRLHDHRDLVTLDLHTVFRDRTNIVVVEWPERVGDGLPAGHIEVHMTHQGPEKRGITITE